MIRIALFIVLLFLTAGSAWLWVKSYSDDVVFSRGTAVTVCMVTWTKGSFHYAMWSNNDDIVRDVNRDFYKFGFRVSTRRFREGSRLFLWLPCWALTALLGFYPLVSLMRRPPWLGFRCRRDGRCVKCGYDLRGILARVDDIRCPECGTVEAIKAVR